MIISDENLLLLEPLYLTFSFQVKQQLLSEKVSQYLDIQETIATD